MIHLKFLLFVAGSVLWSLPALALHWSGLEVTLEPAIPQVGAELFVRFASLAGACSTPIQAPSRQERVRSELRVFVNIEDYVNCPGELQSERFSLGVLPTGVTSVSIYGCVFPQAPGRPPCGSVPTWQFSVGQASASIAVPAMSRVGSTLLYVALLLIGAQFCRSQRKYDRTNCGSKTWAHRRDPRQLRVQRPQPRRARRSDRARWTAGWPKRSALARRIAPRSTPRNELTISAITI
jgi:hypothetical protein